VIDVAVRAETQYFRPFIHLTGQVLSTCHKPGVHQRTGDEVNGIGPVLAFMEFDI
jgi:hypothetical protein